LGVSRQHLSVHGALFLAYVHPADRFNIEVLLDEAIRQGSPYMATYRWIRPDTNEVRFIHCRASTEPSSKLFKGIMLDITPETSKLRADGDLPLALGDLLTHLDLPGLTLDLELTIRAVNLNDKHYPLSFGVPDFDHDRIAPGVSFLECFQSVASKETMQGILEKLSGPVPHDIQFSLDGFQTILKPLIAHGSPYGVVIFVLDRRGEASARDQVAALERELIQFNAIRTYRDTISAATQEIAGYSALISRHARGNPLLAAISDSLLQSIRELAATTDQLTGPNIPPISKNAIRAKRKGSATTHTLRRASNAHVVFASQSPRCATSHALMLRDSGVICAAADLDETSLTALLRSCPNVSIVILDSPTQERTLTTLLRRLKREAPKVHLVCLASRDDTAHSALLRAGAVVVLSKPATGREIEKTIRTLLTLSPVAE
jgi:CheY-like chemotaxis protein